jgi:hypothetical protein
MQFVIDPNIKHESDKRVAFMEQIRAWEPDWFAITVGRADLIDPEGPVTLENLRLDPYLLKLVDVVRYEDGEQLYPVTQVTNPDRHRKYGRGAYGEGTSVVESGKSD